MPAQGRGANLPPPKASAPTWGPLRSGYVPSTHVVSQGPAPKVQPKAPATKPERTLFTGLGQRTIPNVKQPQPSRSERSYERQNQKIAANKYLGALSREAAVTGRINPNLILHDTGRPNMAYATPGQPPKQSIFEKAFGLISQGQHALEGGVTGAIRAFKGLPGTHGGMENLESLKERRESTARLGTVGTQALEIAATGGAGIAGRAAASALEAGRAAKLIESGLQSREALGLIGGKAPETASLGRIAKEAVAQEGTRAPSVASRALRLGAGTSAAYGKLLTQADVAKAGVSAAPGEPKPHESFAGKFLHSALSTIANLPAAVVSAPLHPIKTIQGIAKIYGDPVHAWNENPFGTALAFIAPASGVERAAGGLIRKASQNGVLPLERPDLAYRSGDTMPRQYQPGAISGAVQRVPDAVMKRLGKGERPVFQQIQKFPERTPGKGSTAVAYHGTSVHPDEILSKGINRQSYLAENPKQASTYSTNGGFLYEVNRRGVKTSGSGSEIKLEDRAHPEHIRLMPQTQVYVSHSDLQALKGKVSTALYNKLDTSSVQHLINPDEARTLAQVHPNEFVRRELQDWVDAYEKHGPREPLPNVREATKLQERRDILGSRLGGVVRPGQVDFIRNNERVGANLGVMEANHFLTEHLPTDEAHATALMTFHQGEARNADTFWKDVANRQAELKDNLKKATGGSRALIQQQIDAFTHMEQNRASISHADLQHYEKSAGEVAAKQAEQWMRLNREGVGEPGQLAARDALALHIHGHEMGRGQLTHVTEPGPHFLVGASKVADDAVGKARQELHDARVAVQAVGGKVGPIRTGGVKSGPHFRLERAQEQYKEALLHRHDIENKLSTAIHSKALDPHGNMWPGWYDGEGKYVTPAEREAFIKKHFGREMGFLTHKEPIVGARSLNTYGPRTVYPMRTVTNGPLGAYDRTPAALRNHFERTARNLATMRGHRAVAEHLALMDEHGNPFTEANAKRAADNLNATADGRVVAQHLGPWVPYNFGAEKVASLITGHPYTKVLEQMGQVEHKAMLEEADKAPTFGLLPEKVANRLYKWDHLEHSSAQNMARMITTPWRQTNLYTSVRWPFGTTQENAIRLAAHQVSPLVVLPFGMKYTSISFGTGSHIPRMLEDKINDPNTPYGVKQQALFQRALYGTGNLVGSQLHELEPALHHLTEDSFWGKMAENPLNTKGWRPYRKAVGGALNKMETNAKTAAGGKLALNDAKFFDKFRAVSREQAAHDYVEKITSDPGQSIKAAQDLLEVMGNWMHLTPLTRSAQMSWAPFALWWLNSAKFIFKTLPRDHPYATGLLAAMATATGQENRNLKEYLEGTVPVTFPFLGKINLNPVHYSPFDVANAPIEKAGSMILPQVAEPVMTSKGIDPLTGEKFEGEKPGEGGEDVAAGRLGVSLLESYIPGLRLASQVSRQGGRLGKTATFPWEIQKGTAKGYDKAIAKALLPFMFTYQSKAQKKEEEAKKEAAAPEAPTGRSIPERTTREGSERATPERKSAVRER